MIHISNGSGKLEGIPSINTPTTTNAFCQKMQAIDSVCKSCYAQRFEKFRPNILAGFTKNLEALTKSELMDMPFLNFAYVRFHSYGELVNSIHFKNFVKIANANKRTTFTLWTKRKDIIQRYINEGHYIPSNLILIYSNHKLDTKKTKPPKGFDKIFNVFSKPYLKENPVTINCGSKSCKDCMLCYTKNSVSVINEVKK